MLAENLLMQRRAGSRAWRGGAAVCATLLWLGMMLGAAALLAGSESNARRAITQLAQTRVQSGAQFAGIYVENILAEEHQQAVAWLTGSRITDRQLRLAADALGARQAILIDSAGRVLGARPTTAGLLGTDVALAYPYLSVALAGRRSVSEVVASTSAGSSIVAFAVPFASRHGLRVLSVAFAVSQTPLGAFTSHLLTVRGNHVYLTDAAGILIAGDRSSLFGTSLGHVDHPLSTAAHHATTGTYTSPGGEQLFTSADVRGTPWRIVASEPAIEAFTSIDGFSRTLAWLAFAALTVAGLVIIAIGLRLARSHRQLIDLAAQLERVARVDPLTGLKNRRDLDQTLTAAVCAAQRTDRPLAVLLIDIDHFKQVNDTLGHDAGDQVLASVAAAMSKALRVTDHLGRWGGEEFLAILPDSDAHEAQIVAERLRCEVRQTVTARHEPVTVTIGVASYDADTATELIARADTALYAGKAAGRDAVEIAAPVQRHSPRPRRDPLASAGAGIGSPTDREESRLASCR